MNRNCVGSRLSGDLPVGDGWKNELRASANLVGIHDGRINGEDFRVTKAAAQILLRELPEGIATLNSDRFPGCRREGT